MSKETLIKNARYDFLSGGKIGCVHVEVDCKTIYGNSSKDRFNRILGVRG
jgi:hypothetical protein